VIIWGSDDVLRAWLNVRGANFDRESGADPMAGMRLLEEFIFAVRKDLGLERKNLKEGDLLRLFINDLDKSTTRP
jgi:hypothetical protein